MRPADAAAPIQDVNPYGAWGSGWMAAFVPDFKRAGHTPNRLPGDGSLLAACLSNLPVVTTHIPPQRK